jgi:hypothetical protein
VSFFSGAQYQAESDDQIQEIRLALQDLATLPPDELRRRRYSDYQMKAGQWNLPTLLMRYFVPADLQVVHEDALYRDAQAPEAKEVIRKQIRAIDAGRQVTTPDGRK